jgi:hypothetical protein
MKCRTGLPCERSMTDDSRWPVNFPVGGPPR